ncbi:MAG: hypothetical protein KDI53_10435 [Candidatus Accumulibacter sp.]|nr:hypothetical protein [Accumulibacter sp.]
MFGAVLSPRVGETIADAGKPLVVLGRPAASTANPGIADSWALDWQFIRN